MYNHEAQWAEVMFNEWKADGVKVDHMCQVRNAAPNELVRTQICSWCVTRRSGTDEASVTKQATHIHTHTHTHTHTHQHKFTNSCPSDRARRVGMGPRDT